MDNCYLVIKRVQIKGVDQVYKCKFESGLNIIWGDMDSGKSSILNLIDYCLGGKGNELDYDEIKAKGRSVYLEVDLNGSITTFERVLHYDDNVIKVYNCNLESIDSVYPKLCSPTIQVEQPDGWVSDLILEKLNIPRVKIKESKFRDDASAHRLSFRDLMKLIYLGQKKVASENLMDAANGALLNKNVEIQKFVYGIHDDQLPELNAELKNATRILSDLEVKASNIRDFLKSTDSLAVNDIELLELRETVDSIDNEIANLTSKKSNSKLISYEFNRQLTELGNVVIQKKNKVSSNNNKIDGLITLKATYEHDLQCLNTSNTFKKYNSTSDRDLSFDCPLCESKLDIDSPVLTQFEIDSDIKSLKNRIQGCSASIESLNREQDSLLSEIKEINEAILTVRGCFDEDNIKSISPLVDSISTLHNSKKKVYSELARIEKDVKLKNKLTESTDEIANKSRFIVSLKQSIKNIESQLVDVGSVIKKLSTEFNYLMNHSKLSKSYGSSIDNKFLPVFRDRSYSKISSGGVRTIMSVNLYLSRLSYLIKNGGNLPTFLMLDTPGQNIGRYARAKDDEVNLSDPVIYEEIYSQIINIKDLSEKHEKTYQIIIVDNDFPSCLKEGDFNLVKRFDKSDNKYEKGLIYDA